jgi:hypothetical protein
MAKWGKLSEAHGELLFLRHFFFHFLANVFHFLAASPFFLPIFFPVPISTLKQDNTTLMLSNGLCGFKVKNARRKKTQWPKKEGIVAKKEGGVPGVGKSGK